MKLVKLGSIIHQIRGVSYKPSDVKKSDDLDAIGLIRANNIQDDGLNFEDLVWIDKKKVSSGQIIHKGDIVICASSGSKNLVGKAAIADKNLPYAFGAFCKVVRVVAMNDAYVGKFFQSPKYRREISAASAGANINNIRNEHIDEILIPDYDNDKQIEIVKVLDRVQSLISKRRQQLASLDLLVKARFVEMFGDININDKNWETHPLGELCTIVRGGSPRPIEQYLGGDIPWIKIGDATDKDSIYLYSTKEHIIQAGVKKSRLVKSGSLIFANCGVSLGFARIITFDGCIHDGWLAMEDIDCSLDKVFLLQTLNQMTKCFREIAPAGTQPNLNTAIMKEYMQIVPPMALQQKFISFVSRVNKAKLAAQKSLQELETLKKSLMQQYFG